MTTADEENQDGLAGVNFGSCIGGRNGQEEVHYGTYIMSPH